MNSNRRLTLPFRLEDLVALTFFFLCLVVQIVFREVRGLTLSPADVLIIIPAIALLLAKELVHYFVVGKQGEGDPADDLRAFIRPYWDIVRDWFPFLVILLMY
jgi:1,4-dihydroxy-2-naphthoate octaprenyltransferase